MLKAGLTYPEVEADDRNKVSHYNSLHGFFTAEPQRIDATRAFVSRVNALEGDVLLSSETLSNWPIIRQGQTADDYWNGKKRILMRMREEFRERRNVSPDWTDLEMRRICVTFGLKKVAAPKPELRTQFNEVIEAMVRRMINGALVREGAHQGAKAE